MPWRLYIIVTKGILRREEVFRQQNKNDNMEKVKIASHNVNYVIFHITSLPQGCFGSYVRNCAVKC